MNYGNHKLSMVKKTVVMQMEINSPKKHGYYTFGIIKEWFIFRRGIHIVQFPVISG